ncbi:MAG: hypothetical protein M3112_09305 [Actinomycetia bacterium]|nr:hypothetical protein [Actinomycetes bacterium]
MARTHQLTETDGIAASGGDRRLQCPPISLRDLSVADRSGRVQGIDAVSLRRARGIRSFEASPLREYLILCTTIATEAASETKIAT